MKTSTSKRMDSTRCPVIVDRSFGPWAGQCRGGFDFTLLFEETILALLPTCAFLLACPSRLLYLRSKPIRVKRSILMYSKLVRSLRLVSQSENVAHKRIIGSLDILHSTPNSIVDILDKTIEFGNRGFDSTCSCLVVQWHIVPSDKLFRTSENHSTINYP